MQTTFLTLLFLFSCSLAGAQDFWIRAARAELQASEVIFPIRINSSCPTNIVQFGLEYDSTALSFSKLETGKDAAKWDVLVIANQWHPREFSWTNKAMIFYVHGSQADTIRGVDKEVARVSFKLIKRLMTPTIALNVNRYQTALGGFNPEPIEVSSPRLIVSEKNGQPLTVETNTAPNLPENIELFQSYPNPLWAGSFIGSGTTIRFALPKKELVSVKIYNILGKPVKTMLHQSLPAGFHRIFWPGDDDRGEIAVSGIYFVKLQAGEVIKIQRMVLLK